MLEKKTASSMVYTLGELVKSKILYRFYDKTRGKEGLNWPDDFRNVWEISRLTRTGWMTEKRVATARTATSLRKSQTP